MEKPPSISEMITLALALDKLNLKEIRDDHKAVMLPFIAKTEKDRASLLVPGRFESFMDNARIIADEMCRYDIQTWRLRRPITGCGTTTLRGHRKHRHSDGRMKPPSRSLRRRWGLSLNESTLHRGAPIGWRFPLSAAGRIVQRLATIKWSTTPTRTPLTIRFQKSWSTRSSPRSPAGIQGRCPQRAPWD